MRYADIPPGTYFLTDASRTAARLPLACLKAREEDGAVRCTRLNDGAFVDGWAERDELGELTPCTREEARQAAFAIRAAYN